MIFIQSVVCNYLILFDVFINLTDSFVLLIFRRSSVGTFIRQPTESSSKTKAIPPKLDYRSMVSVEDMPELFVSLDSK